MPRLRSSNGVIVNVSDETAARLGTAYQPVEAEKPKTVAKKASSSKTNK